MAFIYSLCSSSKGNSTYVGDESGGVLVDVGISMRALTRSLEFRGLSVSHIKAIFITHEHSDHVKGLLKIGEKLDVPIYGSKETLLYLIHNNLMPAKASVYEINKKSCCAADMEVCAFKTPHDCENSIGYRFKLPSGNTACVCTDLGEMTNEVFENISGCDSLLLESNYDDNMLMLGAYPYFLKQRIRGANGHLSNDICSGTLKRLLESGTKHFLLGHLSEKNNTPALAYASALEALSEEQAILNRDFTLDIAPVQTIGNIVEIDGEV